MSHSAPAEQLPNKLPPSSSHPQRENRAVDSRRSKKMHRQQQDIKSPTHRSEQISTIPIQSQQTSNAPTSAMPSSSSSSPSSTANPDQQAQQWILMSAADVMRQRMSLASDQLNTSMRQLYQSASSMTEAANATYLAGPMQATTAPPPAYQNIPGIVPYYRGRSSGPPPSYDDVINPFAPPPTYQSLFGQMREARKSSRSLVELLKKLLIIVLSTVGCTILVALMILIPFTMIIIGAVYIDDCRVEHIPTFLLLGGLVWASKNILHCYGQCQKIDQVNISSSDSNNFPIPRSSTQSQVIGSTGANYTDQNEYSYAASNYRGQDRLKSSICESMLNCILIGWFIAGCVIVFRNYKPNFDNPNSAKYCNRIVYMYTFWLITSALIFCSLFVSCVCCLMVNSIVSSRQHLVPMRPTSVAANQQDLA